MSKPAKPYEKFRGLLMVVLCLMGVPLPAQAQPGMGAGATCTLSGQSRMPAGATLHAADGKPVARFSGAESPLVATAFPATASGRAQVRTGTGSGSFRVQGLVDVVKIPVFTAQALPVVPGHVWLGQKRRVSVVGAAAGRLKVQKTLSYPLAQTFAAWGPCSAFTLAQGSPPAVAPAGDAQGYVLKRAALELFDGAGPKNLVVTALHRAPSAPGVLFFSNERRGAWVRVELRGEVLIDAWARASELEKLPRGETMDQLAQYAGGTAPPRVALSGQPRIVRTTKEVTLRGAASDAEPPIGVIEIGTDTYVLDVVAGWASVMPRSMHVLPPVNGQFWVKAADLGI